MGSGIIIPGRPQPRGVNPTEALQMVIQQLNSIAMEINLINVRMQVFQNIILAKKVTDVPELEAEWNKLMDEAKTLSANARLVTPDGHAIVPGPAGQDMDGGVEPGLTGSDAKLYGDGGGPVGEPEGHA